ncbi:MAG: hypothetical protein Q6M04_14930 [Thermostichus sp. BF3_bins_97]
MSDPTLQDLKDLIIALDKKMDLQFLQLQSELQEVRAEVRQVETKLTGEIQRLEERVDGIEAKLTVKIDGVESTLTEKINTVEEKLIAKIDGLSKRMDFQEFISRGAIITLVGGSITGFVKYLFFSDGSL